MSASPAAAPSQAGSAPGAAGDVRVVALYFPQFHTIPENDAWWGKGFTDWNNVRRARPQFRGHYQPRVPASGRYYDQSETATLAWQIDLARRHGIHGFCHYHYWFDGKQLLETPTNRMLHSQDLNFPLCLAWANETWSRRWDGQDHHILQLQTHRPDRTLWMQHFDYLFRQWSDPRAITVDGKPVFLIYRPHRIDEIGNMFDLWRNEAQRRGLPGLCLVAMKQYEFPVPDVLRHFDATMHFQPFEALYSPDYAGPSAGVGAPGAPVSDVVRHRFWPALRRRLMVPFRMLPDRVQHVFKLARAKLTPPTLTIYDYESVWEQILKVERDAEGMPCFPGAFVDWDNTARYGRRARLFRGASPERFDHWFQRLVAVTAMRPETERLIFLNAWNEWSESTYLEPDDRHGLRHLESIRDALAGASPGSHPG